jgi:hypothetical protein
MINYKTLIEQTIGSKEIVSIADINKLKVATYKQFWDEVKEMEWPARRRLYDKLVREFRNKKRFLLIEVKE